MPKEPKLEDQFTEEQLAEHERRARDSDKIMRERNKENPPAPEVEPVAAVVEPPLQKEIDKAERKSKR
jgi:hypothetical protein